MPTPLAELELPTYAIDDGRALTEQWAQLDRVRGRHWLARHPLGFGYLLTRHEDCVAILRDPRWHSAAALIGDRAGITDERWLARRRRPSILSAEGEVHQRLRRLVAPAFTPRQSDRLRPLMRQVIGRLVDAVVPTGRTELVADVCEPYPIPIICELLGAPEEDWALFSRWATQIFQVFNDDVADHVDEILAAQGELDAYVTDLIARRRAAPRDDLLSALIAVEEQGDRLDTAELVMLAEAVLLAGTDTTRNQLACAVAVFAEHPDQWALLAGQAELAGRAVEESLRYLGTVRGTGRFASEDLVYRDVAFPAGTVVFPSFVAANHDPDCFVEPHRFDITAERSASHLTFGFGPHYCLGANLARAELQEALPLLARRLPDLRLDGEVTWKPAGVGIWGPARLPLAFTPTPS
jgi:cytochrome P450